AWTSPEAATTRSRRLAATAPQRPVLIGPGLLSGQLVSAVPAPRERSSWSGRPDVQASYRRGGRPAWIRSPKSPTASRVESTARGPPPPPSPVFAPGLVCLERSIKGRVVAAEGLVNGYMIGARASASFPQSRGESTWRLA